MSNKLSKLSFATDCAAGETFTSFTYSSLAQSVEHMTVNHGVVGSSPTGGAKQNPLSQEGGFLFVLFTKLVKICRQIKELIFQNIHSV